MSITHCKVIKICVLILALSTITACGWRLRGTGVDTKNLPTVDLSGEDVRFVSEVADALLKLGFNTVDPSNAQWNINIINHKFSRKLATVNQSGQATSFLLTLTIQFQLSKHAQDLDQKPANQSVTASIDLQYDQTAVLGKDAEEKVIRQSLLDDTAQQIIYRYRAAAKP